ncbi:UrcA family protein [Novosphingobium rosa]|uniref:UrcA family protein n=1 Tax=Novosphingobium rosa TaxID=76978 RepID=UPI00082BAC7F|nr:UrcA family protein [Novosphingobium rosa]
MSYKMNFLTRSILISGLMMAAATPAMAQDLNRDADLAPRMEINLSGVDVTTAEGEALARHKISGAVRGVCAGVPDHDSFKLQSTACMHVARAEANRQLAALRETQLARRAQTGKTVDYAMKTR